ncbi:hypothetical protein DFH09DRAFT_1094461 [Mycena vulgaris]|nr:hypothetical protein DFH09DRAFT_1094461 [Mycena vulgaris]
MGHTFGVRSKHDACNAEDKSTRELDEGHPLGMGLKNGKTGSGIGTITARAGPRFVNERRITGKSARAWRPDYVRTQTQQAGAFDKWARTRGSMYGVIGSGAGLDECSPALLYGLKRISDGDIHRWRYGEPEPRRRTSGEIQLHISIRRKAQKSKAPRRKMNPVLEDGETAEAFPEAFTLN